jgi:hypothetical protein
VDIIEGSEDVASIAAGPDAFVWRTLQRGLETVIVPAAGGEAVARFAALRLIATHPAGRTWAGWVSGHLHLITLEGDL